MDNEIWLINGGSFDNYFDRSSRVFVFKGKESDAIKLAKKEFDYHEIKNIEEMQNGLILSAIELIKLT